MAATLPRHRKVAVQSEVINKARGPGTNGDWSRRTVRERRVFSCAAAELLPGVVVEHEHHMKIDSTATRANPPEHVSMFSKI